MRILFVQFEEDDGPCRLGDGLEALGATCDVARPYLGDPIPALDGYDGLVVLGGAMNAEEDALYPYLTEAVNALQEALRRDLPALGVCLGGQLLARALGARVWRKPAAEFGYFPIDLTEAGQRDPLFRGLSSPLLTFQWHEDAFDLPAGAIPLADSQRDTLQAFRIGRCYGVQFHPEVTRREVAAWARSSGQMLSLAAEPTSPEALLRRCEEVDQEFSAQTAQLCRNLVAIAEGRRAERQAPAEGLRPGR